MADRVVIVDSKGIERRLGNIVPTEAVKPKLAMPKVKTYGDEGTDTKLYTREELLKKIAKLSPGPKHRFRPPRHDQDGIGCCNASAVCAAMEHTRKRQGLPYKKLSAGYLYGNINGGVDEGSMLEDGLAFILKHGVCTVDAVPYLDWHSRPARAEQEAPLYRGLEVFHAPTFLHLISGVADGFAGIDGIMWWDNYEPDEQGWIPLKGQNIRSRGPGGHAIYVYKPAARTGPSGKVYLGVWKQGSWQGYAEQFGGCAVLPESAHEGDVGGWWLLRSVVDEGGVIPAEQ